MPGRPNETIDVKRFFTIFYLFYKTRFNGFNFVKFFQFSSDQIYCSTKPTKLWDKTIFKRWI